MKYGTHMDWNNKWKCVSHTSCTFNEQRCTDCTVQDLPEHGVSTVFVNLGNAKLEVIQNLIFRYSDNKNLLHLSENLVRICSQWNQNFVDLLFKLFVCFLSKKGVIENKMKQLLPNTALTLRTDGKNGMKNRIHLKEIEIHHLSQDFFPNTY